MHSKTNLSKTVIAVVFLILYALAGWHQRGWVDWPGLAAVALLVAPVVIVWIEIDKKRDA